MLKGDKLRSKYPTRVPVVFVCHSDIALENLKYLVGESDTIGHILCMIRSQLDIKKYEALFVLVNNTLIPNTAILSTVYAEHKDTTDNLLYMHITKENTFG